MASTVPADKLRKGNASVFFEENRTAVRILHQPTQEAPAVAC